MIPLLIGGICVMGLMLGEKLRKSSDPWHNRKEEQNFLREREKWVNDALCRHLH